MNTIRKILAVKHLYYDDLPDVTTEIINSFVFYDIETIRIKKLKEEIHFTILLGEYFDNLGHWGLHLNYAGINNAHIQFQVCNCTKCGNYECVSTVQETELLHNNVICHCN